MNKRIVFFLIGMVFTTICGAKDKSSKVKPPRANLHAAAIQGNLKAVEQHIAAGSDLNVKEPEVGSTPLITAALFGQTEVARALIKAGADLDVKNNDGSTALLTAAFVCRTEIVKLLLDHGADKTLANNTGATPLVTVSAPFENVKPIYEQLQKALAPLGLQLDYDYLEAIRPKIAEMLQ
jgi:ankyrin repeat protein